MKSVDELLKDKKASVEDLKERHKYVTKEYQDYGYRIALKLDELKNVSLYIKLAKNKPRALLEKAFSFAIDYPNARHKGRIFMWKLKELEKEMQEASKESESKDSDKSNKSDKPPADKKKKRKPKK